MEQQQGPNMKTVECEVINCQYNHDGICTAEKLEVSTDHPWPTATSSVGTACQTFKPKDESIYHPDTV